jgi:cell division protein FtsB
MVTCPLTKILQTMAGIKRLAKARYIRWVELLFAWFTAPDVFISYARSDGFDFALALANGLGKKGLSVYADLFGSEPGHRTPQSVLKRARNAKLMVLVATPAALQSSAVKQEIEESAPGRPLLPIRLGVDVTELSTLSAKLVGLASGTQELSEDGAIAPSEAQLQRIQFAVGSLQQSRRIRWSAALAATLIGISLTTLGWSLHQTRALGSQRDDLKKQVETLSAEKATTKSEVADLETQKQRLQRIVEAKEMEVKFQQGMTDFESAARRQVEDQYFVEPILNRYPKVEGCFPGSWPPTSSVLVPFIGQRIDFVQAVKDLLREIAQCTSQDQSRLILFWNGDSTDTSAELAKKRLQVVADALKKGGVDAKNISITNHSAAEAKFKKPIDTGVAILVKNRVQ